MPDLQTSLALHTIRLAYRELGSRVNRAIHTQVGDEARLNEQAGDAHRLMTALELVYLFTLILFQPTQRQWIFSMLPSHQLNTAS
jgi:hypothetical protein